MEIGAVFAPLISDDRRASGSGYERDGTAGSDRLARGLDDEDGRDFRGSRGRRGGDDQLGGLAGGGAGRVGGDNGVDARVIAGDADEREGRAGEAVEVGSVFLPLIGDRWRARGGGHERNGKSGCNGLTAGLEGERRCDRRRRDGFENIGIGGVAIRIIGAQAILIGGSLGQTCLRVSRDVCTDHRDLIEINAVNGALDFEPELVVGIVIPEERHSGRERGEARHQSQQGDRPRTPARQGCCYHEARLGMKSALILGEDPIVGLRATQCSQSSSDFFQPVFHQFLTCF